MSKVILNKENCKACGYCVAACPQEALSLSQELNSKGYQMVVIDEAKCIQCGVCYFMCPDYVFTIYGERGKECEEADERE